MGGPLAALNNVAVTAPAVDTALKAKMRSFQRQNRVIEVFCCCDITIWSVGRAFFFRSETHWSKKTPALPFCAMETTRQKAAKRAPFIKMNGKRGGGGLPCGTAAAAAAATSIALIFLVQS